MHRVLVAEKIADPGLDALRAAGHEVDVRIGLSPEELREAIAGVSGLIVRSATQVDAELIAAAGPSLAVVGRAGVGLDNVDTAAATANGVMVVNAPESNITSAAEHTMALLLAQARNVPQAHGALVDGRWERSKWEGVELEDKTLGVVGFGRIGRLVAHRAAAFGMKIVAHDPFVPAEAAKHLDVEFLELDDLMARADFLTLHVAKTRETIGLINKERLGLAKPHLRIVNVARGGIIDELALAEAVASGQIAGAAIDVFDDEPTTESPLIGVPGIVTTPHLGASTREAQDRAGETIAEQVIKALAGDFVPFAVNVEAGVNSRTSLVAGGKGLKGFRFNQPRSRKRFFRASIDEGVVVHGEEQDCHQGERLKHGEPASMTMVRGLVVLFVLQFFSLVFGLWTRLACRCLHKRKKSLNRC